MATDSIRPSEEKSHFIVAVLSGVIITIIWQMLPGFAYVLVGASSSSALVVLNVELSLLIGGGLSGWMARRRQVLAGILSGTFGAVLKIVDHLLHGDMSTSSFILIVLNYTLMSMLGAIIAVWLFKGRQTLPGQVPRSRWGLKTGLVVGFLVIIIALSAIGLLYQGRTNSTALHTEKSTITASRSLAPLPTQKSTATVQSSPTILPTHEIIPIVQSSPTFSPNQNQLSALTLEIPANSEEGMSTGLHVTKGQTIQFDAAGTWCWGGFNLECSGPNGTTGRPSSGELPVTLDGQYFGALIGKVGDWYFPIGQQAQVTLHSDGILYLFMNDRVGSYGDNGGYITVSIKLYSQNQSTPTIKTSTFTSIPNDAEVILTQCTQQWQVCRNLSSSDAMWTNLTVGTVGATSFGGHYTIQRVLLYFDTNSIPENATITHVVLHIHIGNYLNGNTTFNVVQSTAQLSPSAADFSRVGDQSGGSIKPISSNVWLEIPLIESSLGWIMPAGLTRLALRNDLDLLNVTPTSTNDALVSLYESGQYAPYLNVTYTVP